MKQQPTSHIIKGLIIAAILIGLNLLLVLSPLKNAAWFAFLPTVILVVLNIANVIHYSRQLNFNCSFGNGFAFGFKTVAVVTCVMFVYTWLSLNYFFPLMKADALRQTREAIAKQPDVLPGKVEELTANAMKNYMPFRMSLVIMSTLVVGAVGAAIGAGLAPKSKNN
jgi:Protein of unknown function (DUF4199)